MNYLAGIFYLLLVLVIGLFFPPLLYIIIPVGIIVVLKFGWDAIFSKDDSTVIQEALDDVQRRIIEKETLKIKSARQEVAQNNVFNGSGVEIALLKEIDNFHPQTILLIAALKGDSSSQYSAGIMFAKGEGVQQNIGVGVSLLTAAEAQGNVLAREWLWKNGSSLQRRL